MLLPGPAAAQLLQEEAEQEGDEGQAVARGSPHAGTGQWAGSAGPHSTMVQHRGATSNTSCKQRRGKAAAVPTGAGWALGSCAWDTPDLPPPWELQHIPCPGIWQASCSRVDGVWGDAPIMWYLEHWDLGILGVIGRRAVVNPPTGSQSLGILCSESAQTPVLGRAW